MNRSGHHGRGGAGRGGFTLVELLVVIGIIAMVSAIAVPTIFGAVASSRNAATKVEVDLLHTALMNYKNEYGSFPPANLNGLWTGSGLNKGHAAYKHLVKIFPRISEDESASGPYPVLAQLSPAQALVFWLQGFYQNPTNPLTNGGSPGTRQKLFDFEETRLYAASAYTPGSAQTFSPRTSATLFPVYFSRHPSAGLPYVYFDARCYSTNGSDLQYSATSTSGDTSTAFPYITALPPPNGTWGQQHCNGDTFQIIAPGKDGSYGTVQAAFPRPAGGGGNVYTVGGASYPYANDKASALGHGDNITNFADRALADAIDNLANK